MAERFTSNRLSEGFAEELRDLLGRVQTTSDLVRRQIDRAIAWVDAGATSQEDVIQRVREAIAVLEYAHGVKDEAAIERLKLILERLQRQQARLADIERQHGSRE